MGREHRLACSVRETDSKEDLQKIEVTKFI